MKKRARMTRSKDVHVFKQSYNRTKKINKSTSAQPGGIRL